MDDDVWESYTSSIISLKKQIEIIVGALINQIFWLLCVTRNYGWQKVGIRIRGWFVFIWNFERSQSI